MQRNEEEILKSIFQKEFNARQEPVGDESWDLIAANLDRKRFYKFSFSRFNIFYVFSIVITTVISLGMLIYWFNSIIRPQDQKAAHTITTDTIHITNNKPNNTTAIIQKSPSKITQPFPLSASSSSTKDSQATTHPPFIPADSIFSKTSSIPAQDTSLTIAPKEKPKTVIRKTVYKIKQDTLIQVDTVRSSKRKKK